MSIPFDNLNECSFRKNPFLAHRRTGNFVCLDRHHVLSKWRKHLKCVESHIIDIDTKFTIKTLNIRGQNICSYLSHLLEHSPLALIQREILSHGHMEN